MNQVNTFSTQGKQDFDLFLAILCRKKETTYFLFSYFQVKKNLIHNVQCGPSMRTQKEARKKPSSIS